MFPMWRFSTFCGHPHDIQCDVTESTFASAAEKWTVMGPELLDHFSLGIYAMIKAVSRLIRP